MDDDRTEQCGEAPQTSVVDPGGEVSGVVGGGDWSGFSAGDRRPVGGDRSTVTSTVKTAKQGALDRLAASRPGRAGKSPEQVALEDAEAEITRLRETITEQAVELHLHRGKESWG